MVWNRDIPDETSCPQGLAILTRMNSSLYSLPARVESMANQCMSVLNNELDRTVCDNVVLELAQLEGIYGTMNAEEDKIYSDCDADFAGIDQMFPSFDPVIDDLRRVREQITDALTAFEQKVSRINVRRDGDDLAGYGWRWQ
jgi:hypothetical protein